MWIFNFVDPHWSYEDLKAYIHQINSLENRANKDRACFMSHLARHDANGTRTKLVELFNQIEQVSCAGKLLNNTDELKTEFNDNKRTYLRKFRFNLCPENTSVEGYVTEKCLESIMSGCIPVYWGNDSAEIEPEILNQNAILRYTGNNEAELVAKVRELYSSETAYQAFIQQKPFKENAADVIWEKLQQLEKRLTDLARE
ncbi:hypothetical protein GVX76_07485 [[Haemophilus] felis]|nr:hypothetical protein [[Haemophilus] felis]